MLQLTEQQIKSVSGAFGLTIPIGSSTLDIQFSEGSFSAKLKGSDSTYEVLGVDINTNYINFWASDFKFYISNGGSVDFSFPFGNFHFPINLSW